MTNNPSVFTSGGEQFTKSLNFSIDFSCNLQEQITYNKKENENDDAELEWTWIAELNFTNRNTLALCPT